MKVAYLSSSVIPSKNANSVNVMKMCQAFAQNGHDVTLVGIKSKKLEEPFSYYNVKNTFSLKLTKSNIFCRLFESYRVAKSSDLIYSRWAVVALLMSLISKKKIIFEYHHLPKNRKNSIIEFFLIRSKKVIEHVFITKVLKEDYLKKYPVLKEKHILVLPDGADIYTKPILNHETHSQDNISCVYIGSFYKGKGVETVVKLARKMDSTTFHIVGGENEEVEKYKEIYNGNNIVWHGYLPQEAAMRVLEKSDIALLPNQEKIIIGDNKTNIGKWTSPMKLFEYMSLGKAIVASDLLVLREILTDGENALLVKPDDIEEWIKAIEKIKNNKLLFSYLSKNAKWDLENKYSWGIRAQKVLYLEGKEWLE